MVGAVYKADFHTHSLASPDGSLTLEDYRTMLAGNLDYIAITDHDTIAFALQAQQTLGEHIIVGEEISAQEGELIGLFLTERVLPGLPCRETAELITRQGGLVYVPHPFETVRHGLPVTVLDVLVPQIDIVEVRNGRALFQNMSAVAKRWATTHNLAVAASSDAHGRQGWGKTYTILAEPPTVKNLRTLLARPRLAEQTVGLRGVLYPKWNRFRKRRSSR